MKINILGNLSPCKQDYCHKEKITHTPTYEGGDKGERTWFFCLILPCADKIKFVPLKVRKHP